MSLLARFRPPTFVLLVFALLLGTSTGCFKRYTVIKSSGPPSALQGTGAMAIQFDTSNIAISKDRKSEQDWLASREKDEHRANYTESVQEANAKFLEGLQQRASGVQFSVGQAPAGEIQVTVSWIWWEEGMYAAVVSLNIHPTMPRAPGSR